MNRSIEDLMLELARAEQERDEALAKVKRLSREGRDGCVFCCAGVPKEHRGEAHKICSAP